MKINIDVQPLLSAKSGVGYYISGLIQGLGQIDQANDYQLSFFDFKGKGRALAAPNKNFRWVRNPLPGRAISCLWKNVKFPSYDVFFGKADVYHFPNFVIRPLHTGRKIVTVHDVSFLRYPQHTEPKNLKFLKSEMDETIQTADAIITISRFTRDELLSFFKIQPERLHVIHLGLDPRFQSCVTQKNSTILFVGTMEPRKNIESLLAAFEILMDRTKGKRSPCQDYSLVLAGMKGWLYDGIFKKMDEHRYRDKIRYLDYVSEEVLLRLYGEASLFVYPSHYEGFGLPPLEAMAAGVPVIAARRGSLPEVLGDAAEWVEPEDIEGLAARMETLLMDEKQKEDLVQRGQAQARKYRWEEAAKKTLQVYCGG